MKKILLIIFIIIKIVLTCNAQDTLRVEKSIYYTKENIPMRVKENSSTIKYAREDIVFSPTRRRVEYCYYFENERRCFGNTYELINDSILYIDGQTWIYIKSGDRYFVKREKDIFIEYGFVSTLIPFETSGHFTTITIDKHDTLWYTNYPIDIPSIRDEQLSIKFHKSNIEDVVYQSNEIEKYPCFMNGDSIKSIHISQSFGCISEPYYHIKEAKFIITKNGRIVNVDQSIGNYDTDCPNYLINLITEILKLGQLEPAKIGNENVNVLWKLKVEVNNE